MATGLLRDLAATWQLNETRGSRYGIVGGQTLTPKKLVAGVNTVDTAVVSRAAGPPLMGGYAAQFTAASSSHLERVSSSTLQLGGLTTTGWWIWCWVKFTSLPASNATMAFLSKNDSTVGHEYGLSLLNNGGSQWDLSCSVIGVTTATKTLAATPGTTDWHLVEGWWDPDLDTLNVAYDGSAPTTSVAASAHVSNEAVFNLGASNHLANYLNGLLAGPGIRKRYPTSSERADLWNGGAGRLYPYGPATNGGSRQVRLDNTSGSSTVSAGAPLPLFLPPSFDWGDVYWGNGDDLAATDSAGNALTLWPEEVDAGNRYGRLWIAAPTGGVAVGATADITLTSGDPTKQSSANFDTLFSKRTVDGSTVALFHLDTIAAGSSSSATGGYTMTLVGTPTEQATDGGNFRVVDPPWQFATGKHVTFNGTSQYATSSTLLDNPPASGCVSLWFKLEAAPGAADTLLCKASSFSGAAITNGLQVAFGSDTKRLEFSVTNASVTDTAIIELGGGWGTGVWHHLVVSWGTKLTIWLNGTKVGEVAHTGAWANGSSAAFAVGAKLVATASDHLACSVDEIEVRSAEPTRATVGKWFNREGLTQLYEHDRWTRSGSNPVIAPTGLTGESTAVFEPKIVRKAAGSWTGCYTGGISTPALYGISSTDGKAFTKSGGRIMGQGTGGHSGAAVRGNVFRDDDGSLYLYFSDAIATTGGNIRYATTANGGTSWTHQGIVRAPTGTHAGYANSSVVRVGSTYYWVIEYVTAGVEYRIAAFTSTSPTGSLTLLDDVLPQLTIQQRGTFSVGGLTYFDGKFHMFPHLSRVANLPTGVWHAVSEDLRRWDLRGGADPIMDLEDTATLARQDQAADGYVYALPDTGEVGLLYDIDDNHGGGYVARCMLATFTGSLSDLA